MNIVVFDTETTDLKKPFCYNVGYRIVNGDTWEALLEREYCCQQTWHNLQLFQSAYYADKRPLYVERMRKHEVILEKWGYIMQQMIRDFRAFEVVAAYAYNSPFDDGVFHYNCDWFRTQNPFDNIPIFDIRGYVQAFMVDDTFKKFCEDNSYFTEAGNYSTTAEVLFRYISEDYDFTEEHTALSDSRIETEILRACIESGAEWATNYKTGSVPRLVEKELSIGYKGEEFTTYRYTKKYERNGKITLTK